MLSINPFIQGKAVAAFILLLRKSKWIWLFLLVSIGCLNATANATKISISDVAMASNGTVALHAYMNHQPQLRLWDPVKEEVVVRIKPDSLDDDASFTSLLADDDRFVFQLLKHGRFPEGIYSFDTTGNVNIVGKTKHKLQAVTKNWFFLTTHDQLKKPFRYDKDYTTERIGHVPGYPELVVFHSQREGQGAWLACLKNIKGKPGRLAGELYLAYLADDDSAAVYPVGAVVDALKITVAVGRDEVWVSADGLSHIFDLQKKVFTKTYKTWRTFYPIASTSNVESAGVLLSNWSDIINLSGNKDRSVHVKPKPKPREDEVSMIISSANRVTLVRQEKIPTLKPRQREISMIGPSTNITVDGKKMILTPAIKPISKPRTQPKPKPELKPKPNLPTGPPRLPLEQYRIVDMGYVEDELPLGGIKPLFVSGETLWCIAGGQYDTAGVSYWLRFPLSGDRPPVYAAMNTTISEKLNTVYQKVGSVIFGVARGLLGGGH